jgi:hypothetical protein
MPSPFPGMNPFLERAGVWQDFHGEFLVTLRRLLVPQVVPEYIVQLEDHLYLHDVPDEPRRLVGRSDLAVAESGEPEEEARGGVGVLEGPKLITLPMQDLERVRYLAIRDRGGRDLVAVIELLSPSNKRPGEDREQYLVKRREILMSPAHLVEIDLLRGGRRMPPEDRSGADPAYSVMLSRAERRPRAEAWPIGLRERLPEIPIPLRPGRGDARVDLQDALQRAFDGPGYEHYIYDGPPEPPLSPEDDAWARRIVPGIG